MKIFEDKKSIEHLCYNLIDYNKEIFNKQKFKETCLKNRLKRKNKKK